jgi:hypothetical protein
LGAGGLEFKSPRPDHSSVPPHLNSCSALPLNLLSQSERSPAPRSAPGAWAPPAESSRPTPAESLAQLRSPASPLIPGRVIPKPTAVKGWNATSPTAILAAISAPAPVSMAVSAPAAAPAITGTDPVALTPEVKYAIAEEVKAQLAAEKAAAQHRESNVNDVLPALDPARRTFVVSSDLTVVADGQECSLTPGDVITRLTDTPDASQKVNVSIASSKQSDCAQSKQVAVSLDDLQEMRNQLH